PEVPRLALAYDAARQLIYVGGYSSAGNLYVVDAASLTITRTMDPDSGSTWPLSAMFEPIRDRLYLSQFNVSGPSHIAVVDPTTLNVVERIALPWQPGATALHANGRLSVAGHGDRGDTITVRVTASDGQTTSAPATASVAVADAAPTASIVIDITSPTTNQVIRAMAISSDADGDALTYTFTWRVDSFV